MPRTRAVDPFAGKRVRRPQRAIAAPPVETPGELGRRMAAAMRERLTAHGTAVQEAATAAMDKAQDAPGTEEGTVTPEEATEASSEPQGPESVALDDWPSAITAAEVLNVDPAEVRRRCREGELPAVKDTSGAWRIDPGALT